MNTNDLPPAAKLAALIEAGRAANPDVLHGTGSYFRDGTACALGYAALAVCGSRDIEAIYTVCLNFQKDINRLHSDVVNANDGGASIEEICQSLREGELAKIAA